MSTIRCTFQSDSKDATLVLEVVGGSDDGQRRTVNLTPEEHESFIDKVCEVIGRVEA